MPTSYTSDLCKKDVPFETFVLRCARNFGALIEMQDEALDAPIPEKFEPSDYSSKALAAAEAQLKMTEALSFTECEARAFSLYQEQREELEREKREKGAIRDRLMAMRAKVADWTPPSQDHQGLKDFMIEQINLTLRWDVKPNRTDPKKLTGEEWRRSIMDRCGRDIEYHTKANREEIQRTESRNNWVAALRKSLTA